MSTGASLRLGLKSFTGAPFAWRRTAPSAALREGLAPLASGARPDLLFATFSTGDGSENLRHAVVFDPCFSTLVLRFEREKKKRRVGVGGEGGGGMEDV